jgi:hypothetical protein
MCDDGDGHRFDLALIAATKERNRGAAGAFSFLARWARAFPVLIESEPDSVLF